MLKVSKKTIPNPRKTSNSLQWMEYIHQQVKLRKMEKSNEPIFVRTKGDFMKAVFTAEELRNIDSAIPIQYWKDDKKFDTFYYVMNFNKNILGTLTDMRVVAKERNINIKY